MIAIVAAVREEVAAFLAAGSFETGKEAGGGVRIHRSPSLPEVAVVVGGIGKERAQAATLSAIHTLRPDAIISAGFAGGVRPGLECGDLVVCDALWCVAGPQSAWSLDSARSIGVSGSELMHRFMAELQGAGQSGILGGCLTVPRVVADHAAKQRIGVEFAVSVIDMESFWVASTAARFGVPHVAVRSVLDPAEQSLPPLAEKLAAGGGAGRVFRVLRYLLFRPGQAPGLLSLAAQAKVAGASLASLLRASTDTVRHSPPI